VTQAASVLAPEVWADLLADAATAAHAELTESISAAEAYRTCLRAALRLLHDEQQAHAATRRRYQALLAERRGPRQAARREAAA
jgi:hypothetical protein